MAEIQQTTRELSTSLQEYGIQIRDTELLETSLTHTTYSYEKNLPLNNQRLEFLGDSVLSLVVVEYLYKGFPEKPEGELAEIKSLTVSEETLAGVAREIRLYDYLLIGKGHEKMGGRYMDSVLADAFEALLAAIYLDQGYAKVRSFIHQLLAESIDKIAVTGYKDYKTILQELLQKEYKKSVEYKLLEEIGPEHNRTFKIGVIWEGQVIAIGIAKKKQTAEKQGARQAIEYFSNRE